MQPLVLHHFHTSSRAQFQEINGFEAVADYGDSTAEHKALRQRAGIIDLSFRSRLCLTGVDRVRFLHGQVTNDIKRLSTGDGCYAALVSAKGRMQSDLNVFCLADELLLDFEPGLATTVSQRLEKYIVADDVQVVDVAPYYGLLTVQGPAAEEIVRKSGLFKSPLPTKPMQSVNSSDPELGELYLANNPRLAMSGFDCFIPVQALPAVSARLVDAAAREGGRPCGWGAFEICRIEAGIPRFGVDMDEHTLLPECGIESRAVSFNKGCYIGQEVINRVHTIGHVNRHLRRLHARGEANIPLTHGDKLFRDGKEVGTITSATRSPALQQTVALGYVHRDAAVAGTELTCREQIFEVVES